MNQKLWTQPQPAAGAIIGTYSPNPLKENNRLNKMLGDCVAFQIKYIYVESIQVYYP